MVFKMRYAPAIEDMAPDAQSREARLASINSSQLFDPAWYLDRYPDLAALRDGAAEHFLDHGGLEGRWPHPLFHSDFYLAQNPDIRDSGTNPLIHYMENGAAEGRSPNPLFDTRWYAARYLANAPYAVNPLAHYIDHPLHDTSSAFQSEWYMANAGAPMEDGENPLAHYFRIGRDAGYLCNADNVPDLGNRSYQLLMSGLFDPAFYAASYSDIRQSGSDPFIHFMMSGYREGRTPHPLFDLGYYRTQIPEHERGDINLLLHFFDRGAVEGLNPNYFFDTAWYLREYPACVAEGINPLAHFIRDGGRSTHPSSRFDAAWYLARHADVARAGVNPLTHYLMGGMDEGRATRAIERRNSLVSAVTDAAIVILKDEPRAGTRTVLLVTHSRHGSIKGHVGDMVEAYRQAGADVVLIVAADRRMTAVPRSIVDACSAVYVRANRGFDFGAWAHILQVDESLLNSGVLLFTNDSLLGPLDGRQLAAILDRVDASAADFVGLTENTFYSRHVQSFFLALKSTCLSSYGFNRYVADIVNLDTKNEVITTYELTFSARLKSHGLRQEVLFAGDASNNRTIFAWDELLDQGFPFVKASLVVGEHGSIGGDEVRRALTARGFDLDRLEPTYRYAGPVVWADLDGGLQSGGRTRVDFFGPLNIANGLGMASRGYVKALHRTDWDLNIHPLERPFHVHARTAPTWQACSFAGSPDVALVHLNADGWNDLLTDGQRQAIDRACLKVGLFVWETSFVPTEWLPTIDALDAIWVPTAFCADIFRAVTPVPVDVVPYVVENEAGQPVSGDAKSEVCRTFGIDPSRRHILYAFDGSSFLARKNPQGLVRAFRASGLGRDGWQLVLKTKHVFDLPLEGRRLLDLVGTGGDVVVIDQPMPRNDLAALFALCDVYASSHASEGFGLTIAEAMEMGKVVVATDYGGSRDFLDASCGFPVRADEVALDASHGPYLRGAVWGQVDEAALADALREAARAVADGTGAEIGTAARARIRGTLSIAAVASAMSASLDRLLAEPDRRRRAARRSTGV